MMTLNHSSIPTKQTVGTACTGEMVIADNLPPARSTHIDIIKGWAMLTIIIFHCSQTFISSSVGQVLGNPWNVPVFFIIAGFFLKESSLDKTIPFLKGRIKRLYLPATIIYALAVLMHNVFVHIGWYPLGGSHPATGAPYYLYGIQDITIKLLRVLAACSSGELAMGAMWFLYSLRYAFVGIAILYKLVATVAKSQKERFSMMSFCVFLLASVSCILSQIYGITFSRISTSITALALIWCGMIINQKWKWQYDSPWGVMIALTVFAHCIIMQKGHMVLAHNCYQDMVQLIAGSTAAIYIYGFGAKKIVHCAVGKFLAWMGRESLYLMAFHIIGFFICNSALEYLGVFSNTSPKGLYTHLIGDNYLLLCLYVMCGIAVPFILLYIWRITQEKVLTRITSIK